MWFGGDTGWPPNLVRFFGLFCLIIGISSFLPFKLRKGQVVGIEQILADHINEFLRLSASELRKINPVTDQIIFTETKKYYLTIWISALPGGDVLIVVQIYNPLFVFFGSRIRRGIVVKSDDTVEINDKYNYLELLDFLNTP